MDLFGNNKNETIRTLAYYEPFGSLMFCNKIETRWVREGKQPPFPLGKYLFYTTKKPCSNMELFNWSGPEIMLEITKALGSPQWPKYNGYAIGMADLTKKAILTADDKPTFVKFVGKEIRKDKDGIEHVYVQWGLHFTNAKKIKPFEWNYGKQGVGFVPDSELHKIEIV